MTFDKSKHLPFIELNEMGYVVIPVKGKATFVKDFNHWAIDGMPEGKAEEFFNKYKFPEYGIGLVAGPASNNIILLDVDSISEDIQKAARRSPLERIGVRGWGAVFINKDGLTNTARERQNKSLSVDPSKKPIEGVELRAVGQYLVIPPSIHPDSREPYKWRGPSIESFDLSDIPDFTIEDLNAFSFISGEGITSTSVTTSPLTGGPFPQTDKTRCAHGSQNRLKTLAMGLIAGKTSIAQAVEKLLDYDKKNHLGISYFEDKTRSDCKADPYSNALKFYANLLETVNRNHSRKREPVEIPTALPTVEFTGKVEKEAIILPPKSFPEVGGILKLFKDAIISISRTKQDALALGGALSIGSVLCANRFSLNGSAVQTSLYTLNVGNSGIGKNAPYVFIYKLFGKEGLGENNFLGLSNYSSDAAIVESLGEQRTRIDLIDEFGEMFRAFNSKNSDVKSRVEGCLNKLYTTRGWYGGHYTKTTGLKGACYDPSITILASIQNEIMIKYASPETLYSGFMGRFMYFVGDPAAEYLGNQRADLTYAMDYIVKTINETLPAYSMIGKDIFGKPIEDTGLHKPVRAPLTLSAKAERFLDDIDRENYLKEKELTKGGDVIQATILSRAGMMIERITYIIAACNGERTITEEHVALAKEIVFTANEQSRSLLAQSSSDGGERKIIKILEKLKKAPGHVIPKRQICKDLNLRASEMKELILTMLERGNITLAQNENKGKTQELLVLSQDH
jgi:hypothetical protein